jgi:hypothetical protein
VRRRSLARKDRASLYRWVCRRWFGRGQLVAREGALAAGNVCEGQKVHGDTAAGSGMDEVA